MKKIDMFEVRLLLHQSNEFWRMFSHYFYRVQKALCGPSCCNSSPLAEAQNMIQGRLDDLRKFHLDRIGGKSERS